MIEPGSVVEETVTFLDFFPTLLAMAGVEKPDGLTLRGRNFLPLLKGESVEGWSNELYAEYSTYHQSNTHMRMWRTERWKLVRDFLNPERDELYDLKNDPDESENLIDSDRAEVRSAIERLHGKIVRQMERIDDPVLEQVRSRSE